MSRTASLTTASLLSILFMTIHLADDIVRGLEKGGPSNLVAVPILVVWLYATVVLTQRRSGYILMFLGSLLGASVPFIHFMGTGGVAGGDIATSPGALFFVWILIALGVSASYTAILSIQGLWNLGWRTRF